MPRRRLSPAAASLLLLAILSLARTAHAQDAVDTFEICEPFCGAGGVQYRIGSYSGACLHLGDRCNDAGTCVRYTDALHCVPTAQVTSASFCCGLYMCPTLPGGEMASGCAITPGTPIGTCVYATSTPSCGTDASAPDARVPDAITREASVTDATAPDVFAQDAGELTDAMVPPDTSVPTMDAMTIAPVHGVQFRGAGCQCDVAAPAAPRTSRGALAFALAIALAFVLRKRD